MQELTPMTELDAINIMLSVIGEAPISSLDAEGLADVAIAKSTLKEVSRVFQTKGWHFNTEYDYPIAADQSGYCVLPSNTLKVDTYGRHAYKDYVQRGTKLYDRKNHTYNIGETTYVEIVFFLDFIELPQSARTYVAYKAAEEFQKRTRGDEELDNFTKQTMVEAWADTVSEECRASDANVFTHQPDAVMTLYRGR